MSESPQGNDMDIKIGIDDSGVDEGLKSVEAKLEALAKGIQSSLSFEINTEAIKKAEESLLALTNIDLDSITEELGQLAMSMMKLNMVDTSSVENLEDMDITSIANFTTELGKLQEALLKTASMEDLVDQESVKGLSTEEVARATNELSAYQAALDGVAGALRSQLRETMEMNSEAYNTTAAQQNIASALEAVEVEMSAVDDATKALSESLKAVGSSTVDSSISSAMADVGNATKAATEQVSQGAKNAQESLQQMGDALKKAFTYDSEEAMIKRGQDLRKFSEDLRQYISELRAQMNITKRSSSDLTDYCDKMRLLHESMAASKSQLREWQKELAFIESQLKASGKSLDDFNNKAASGVNLPVKSTLSTPDSPDTTKVVRGVKEATEYMYEAVEAADNWKEKLAAVGEATKAVVKGAADAAKQTTLLQEITTKLKKEWERMGNIVKGIVFSQMFYGFTHAVSSAINDVKEFRLQVEETQVAFGLMMHDAERGVRLSNRLMDLAADTQLDFQQVNAGARKLTAYGIEAENLEYVLRGVADAAAAAGDTYAFDRMILALGQIQTKGKLAGQEINQLAEAGINARKYLMDGLDVTREQLDQLLRAGLPSDVAIRLILDGIQKDYEGAAEQISNTMRGLSSTIKDNFMIIGQGMLDPFFEASKGILTNIRDVLNEWRTIVVEQSFGSLLEHLFPKSFVDQIRLLIANLNLFRESVFKILQALMPFLQSLLNVGMIIANSVLPVINLFLHTLAWGVNIISQNETAMRILTASFMGLMVAKAVSFVMTNFLNIVNGVTKGVVWAAQGVKTLAGILISGAGAVKNFSVSLLMGRLAAGDFTAAISAVIGIITALIFTSEKATQSLTKMMGSLTKTMGHDFNKIYVPKIKQSSSITNEFNNNIGISEESLNKLGDAAKDAGKKAKAAVASFDEVFTLQEQTDTSSGLDDFEMPDFSIPDVEMPDTSGMFDDFLDDVEEAQEEHLSLWDKFWDSWAGKFLKWCAKTLNDIAWWAFETLAGFTTWAVDSLVNFAWWAAESLGKFAWWIGESLLGFGQWAIESLGGFAMWAGESLAGFGMWLVDSLVIFAEWAAGSLINFGIWAAESIGQFVGWAGDSLLEFAKWATLSLGQFGLWMGESVLQFAEWATLSLGKFGLWALESLGEFTTWAGSSLLEFGKWATLSLGEFGLWVGDSLLKFGAWSLESLGKFGLWATESLAGFTSWAADSILEFGKWVTDSLAGFGQWSFDSLATFASWVGDSLGGFGQWALDSLAFFLDWENLSWESIKQWASDTWDTFTGWIGDSLGGFGQWSIDSLNEFGKWIADSAAGFGQWTMDTLSTFGQWVIDSTSEFLKWSAESLQEFGNWVVESTTQFGKWALDSLKEFGNWATESATRFGEWITDSLSEFGRWATESLKEFGNWAIESLKGFGNWASDSLAKFGEWFNTSIAKLGNWCIESIKKFANWSADTIRTFVSWVSDTGGRISSWASDTATRFGNWVADTTGRLSRWASDAYTKIKNWVSDTVSAFSRWVSDTIKAVSNWGSDLWKSIISPLEKVWDKAQDMFGRIGSMVSGVFGGGKKRTIEASFSVDEPNIPQTYDLGITPTLDIKAPRAPLTAGLTTPKAPRLAAESIVSTPSKAAQTDFSGIGKEIAQYLLPALANNHTGTQEQLPPVYVGTLIADERGLRELERKMEVIRLKEGNRRGR